MTAEKKKNIFLQNVSPLSYNATNANKKSEPKWSMGSKIVDVDKRYSPSPNAYDLKGHLIGSNSTKWGFGSEVRKPLNGKSLSPGQEPTLPNLCLLTLRSLSSSWVKRSNL